MTLLVVAVSLLFAAGAVAWLWGVRAWRLMAVAVIATPIVWSLPQTVRSERSLIRADLRMTPVEAKLRPPAAWPGYTNVPLLVGIMRLVPEGKTVTFLPGGWLARGKTPVQARLDYLRTGWVRWLAFVIAPRVVVDSRRAEWVVLADQSPSEAHVKGRHRWRFGRDWLVER